MGDGVKKYGLGVAGILGGYGRVCSFELHRLI